jgi:hypothetical protein
VLYGDTADAVSTSYTVTLDGVLHVFNALPSSNTNRSSANDVDNVLFFASGLSAGMHTLVLENNPMWTGTPQPAQMLSIRHATNSSTSASGDRKLVPLPESVHIASPLTCNLNYLSRRTEAVGTPSTGKPIRYIQSHRTQFSSRSICMTRLGTSLGPYARCGNVLTPSLLARKSRAT